MPDLSLDEENEVDDLGFENALLARIVEAINPDKAAILAFDGETVLASNGVEQGESDIRWELVARAVDSGSSASETTLQHSLLAAPLKNNFGEFYRIVYFELQSPRRLRHKDLNTLQQLILMSKREHARSRQARSKKKAMSRLGKAKRAALSTLNIIIRVLKPERAVIIMEVNEKPKVLASHGIPKEGSLEDASISAALLEHLWKKASPSFIEDVADESHESDFLEAKRFGVRSALGYPIADNQGQTKALIYLDNRTEANAFLSPQMGIVSRFATTFSRDVSEILNKTDENAVPRQEPLNPRASSDTFQESKSGYETKDKLEQETEDTESDVITLEREEIPEVSQELFETTEDKLEPVRSEPIRSDFADTPPDATIELGPEKAAQLRALIEAKSGKEKKEEPPSKPSSWEDEEWHELEFPDSLGHSETQDSNNSLELIESWEPPEMPGPNLVDPSLDPEEEETDEHEAIESPPDSQASPTEESPLFRQEDLPEQSNEYKLEIQKLRDWEAETEAFPEEIESEVPLLLKDEETAASLFPDNDDLEPPAEPVRPLQENPLFQSEPPLLTRKAYEAALDTVENRLFLEPPSFSADEPPEPNEKTEEFLLEEFSYEDAPLSEQDSLDAPLPERRTFEVFPSEEPSESSVPAAGVRPLEAAGDTEELLAKKDVADRAEEEDAEDSERETELPESEEVLDGSEAELDPEPEELAEALSEVEESGAEPEAVNEQPEVEEIAEDSIEDEPEVRDEIEAETEPPEFEQEAPEEQLEAEEDESTKPEPEELAEAPSEAEEQEPELDSPEEQLEVEEIADEDSVEDEPEVQDEIETGTEPPEFEQEAPEEQLEAEEDESTEPEPEELAEAPSEAEEQEPEPESPKEQPEVEETAQEDSVEDEPEERDEIQAETEPPEFEQEAPEAPEKQLEAEEDESTEPEPEAKSEEEAETSTEAEEQETELDSPKEQLEVEEIADKDSVEDEPDERDEIQTESEPPELEQEAPEEQLEAEEVTQEPLEDEPSEPAVEELAEALSEAEEAESEPEPEAEPEIAEEQKINEAAAAREVVKDDKAPEEPKKAPPETIELDTEVEIPSEEPVAEVPVPEPVVAPVPEPVVDPAPEPVVAPVAETKIQAPSIPESAVVLATSRLPEFKPKKKKAPSFWQRLMYLFFPNRQAKEQLVSTLSISGRIGLESGVSSQAPTTVHLSFPSLGTLATLKLAPNQADYIYHLGFEDESPPSFSVTIEKPGFFPVKLANVHPIYDEESELYRALVSEITLIPKSP